MIGLMVLHWGEVNLNIDVSGLDPSSGVIETPVKSGVIPTRKGSGNATITRGRGGTKGVSGSGGT